MRDRVFYTKRGTKITYQADLSGEMNIELSSLNDWILEAKTEQESAISTFQDYMVDTKKSVILTLPIDEALDFVNHLLKNYTNSEIEFSKTLRRLIEIRDGKRATEFEFPPDFEEQAERNSILARNVVNWFAEKDDGPAKEKEKELILSETPRRKKREL